MPALAALAADSAYGGALRAPGLSLEAEALTESTPSPIAPADFGRRVISRSKWEGGAPPAGVTVSLEPGSLQWVRVAEFVVLPRARLRIEIARADGAQATVAGIVTPLPARDGRTVRELLPVGLLSGAASAVEVGYVSEGVEKHFRFRLRFRPRPETAAAPRVLIDASCSRFGLRPAGAGTLRDGEWIYIGCRDV